MTPYELAAQLAIVREQINRYSEHPVKNARKLKRLKQRDRALCLELERVKQ